MRSPDKRSLIIQAGLVLVLDSLVYTNLASDGRSFEVQNLIRCFALVFCLTAVAGIAGSLRNSPTLIKAFAVGITLQFILTILVSATTLVLAFSPHFSRNFCESVTRGEATGLLPEHETRELLSGIDLVSFGIENCEEYYGKIILFSGMGLLSCCLLSLWSSAQAWTYYSSVMRRNGEGWVEVGDFDSKFDTRDSKLPIEEVVDNRQKLARASSLPSRKDRRNSLNGGSSRQKSHSFSSSRRPRLVLIPMLDLSRPLSSSPLSPTKNGIPSPSKSSFSTNSRRHRRLSLTSPTGSNSSDRLPSPSPSLQPLEDLEEGVPSKPNL